jgi:tRNA A37 threonylcarbamoyladenosine synthetase subunit TsaC/SUA5/YrdC
MSSKPIIMDINANGVIEAANHFMRRSAVIIQLPSVYALFSMPNQQGADYIDQAKNRRAGKNYGTTIGNLQSFLSMSSQETPLTRTFCDPDFDPMLRRHLEGSLNRAFLRIDIGSHTLNNTAIRKGTHQALLLTGDHGRLFNALEDKLSDTADESLFNGNHYSAPLCSSANISGDPDGSIITWDRALEFAIDRDVPMIIKAASAPGEQGSFPIFSLENDQVLVHREGPMLQALKASLEQIIALDKSYRVEESIRIAA